MSANTRPCDSAADRTLRATASRNPNTAALSRRDVNRCRNTPARSYSRIQRKCRSTVRGLYAEYTSALPSVRQRERRRATLVRGELGNVGPHVDAQCRGAGRRAAPKPVFPRAERRSVIRTPKPALIAKQQFPIQRGRIDGCRPAIRCRPARQSSSLRRPALRRFCNPRGDSRPGPRSQPLSRCHAGVMVRVHEAILHFPVTPARAVRGS